MREMWGTKKLANEARAAGRPVSQVYLQELCRKGIIRGAQKPVRDWLIPEDEARRWLVEWVNDS